ncbi:hypothetical protein [Dyella mobilis]|uniref:Uncharacterized protein n=1 Tax=Dyella mobilis TaxID=1849582 RepID=A0ABS2KC18_9GAMM|nr:hypothetical protein [Dyella mobilis]MBM7128731.1 hypothetical protein [Dyella mobilis]GLQ99058.1 hypothetical protein GCM10007863_34780 [Dyella mobilis]
MTETSIEVFQDLRLQTLPGGASVREAILGEVRAPWRHAMEKEKVLLSAGSHSKDVIALVREPFEGIDRSALVLWEDADGYYVSNIVPESVGQLSIAQYNTILQDFVACIATPASRSGAFRVELTSAQRSLADWLDAGTAAALRRFSGAANKSTGAAHPLDQERWFQFLIRAHRSSARMSPGDLARWLREVDAWPEESAHELAVEYEFASALLQTYDAFQS